MRNGISKTRARRSQPKLDKQHGPDRPPRKRRHTAEDKERADHTHKSPRVRKTVSVLISISRIHLPFASSLCSPFTADKRPHNHQGRGGLQTPRKSHSSREAQDSNQARIAQAGRQTRSSTKTIEAHRIVEQEAPQAERRFLRTPKNSEQCCLPKEKEEEQPESFLTNLEAQRSSLLSLSLSRTNNVINSRAVEPRRRIKDSDSLDHSVERPKDDHAERQPISQLKRSKREIIDIWLSNTSWSRRDDETSPQESPKGMAQKPADVLSPPDESFQSAITFSKKSLKSVASVRDLNYRHSLLCRNIFIQREDPPEEMMQRAKKLISRRRTSPEIDDDAAEELKKEARRCQDKAEDAIAERLAAHIIPAMKKFPDSRLKMSPGQQWYNSVLIPLNSNVLITPLPLPKPKPNLAYGYSEAAFDEKQLLTIDLLIDDQSGRSYASPDQVLQFPFLDVEFKSQAKNETLYMATNQVAGAGAIALNGYLELICRSFGAERFDFDEPHFFSVAMDQDFAHVNVHWIGKPAEGGQYSFHVERLSSHVLSESNGLRSLQRAIKNILDYGLNVRLRTVCEALDALRQNFISERQAVNTERDQRSIVQTQPEPKQRARGKRAQLPSHNEQEIQGRNDPQVEESKKVKKSRGNKAQENMQPVRRSRRQQIMAQQEQSQVNDQTKATRPKRPFSAIHDDQEIWIWTGWNL